MKRQRTEAKYGLLKAITSKLAKPVHIFPYLVELITFMITWGMQ